MFQISCYYSTNFNFFLYIAKGIWKDKAVKKTLTSLLFLINILVVISLIISYLSVFIPPDKFWIPALFGLAFPFLAIINLSFMVFWLFVKPNFFLLSLITFLVGFGYHARYFQIKGKHTKNIGIKVLTYNVRFFSGDGDANQKENAQRIVDFLNEQEPDIICLQETRLRQNNIFNLPNTVKNLKSIEHYQYARSSTTYGSVTMTRFPIIKMSEIRFDNSRNMSIYTDIKIDADTIRVFNVHLQSYLIDPNKYSIIDSPGFDEEQDIKEMREMGSKYKKAVQLRAEQAREIRKYIDESPYPVIVCGDFNDSPISYSYEKLRGDFNDAFVSSGHGLGRTYIGKLPSYRIDNILYSDKFKSFNFQTLDFRMSDHLPVSCTLIKK